MGMVRATVWLDENDLDTLTRIEAAADARGLEVGLPMPAETQRELILSQAVTEGLPHLAARWTTSEPPPDAPAPGRFAAEIQRIFNSVPA